QLPVSAAVAAAWPPRRLPSARAVRAVPDRPDPFPARCAPVPGNGRHGASSGIRRCCYGLGSTCLSLLIDTSVMVCPCIHHRGEQRSQIDLPARLRNHPVPREPVRSSRPLLSKPCEIAAERPAAAAERRLTTRIGWPASRGASILRATPASKEYRA